MAKRPDRDSSSSEDSVRSEEGAVKRGDRKPWQRLGLEERRRQLLDLGKKVFAERAYDELSTDELARLAGVSTGLLYHYFPSKRDFYVATITEVARQVLEDTNPRPGVELSQAIHGSLDAFVRFVEENEGLYRALVTGGIGSDKDVASILQSLRRTSAERLVNLLGLVDIPPRVWLTAYGWIGFIEFTCLRWVEEPTIPREQLLLLLERSLLSLVQDMGTE